MSKSDRKTITEKIKVYDLCWTKMKDLHDNLKKVEQEAKDKGLKEIRFDYHLYDDYGSPSVEFYVQGERPENDVEFEKRTKYEAEQKKYRKEQYESLKKEFEEK